MIYSLIESIKKFLWAPICYMTWIITAEELEWLCGDSATIPPMWGSRDGAGEQGCCGGESTHLPPMWLRFDSRTQHHMWVEFCWFSTLLWEVYLRVLQFSPLLKNQHFQIQSWNAQTFLNKFLWTPWCSVVKQITFLWVLTMLQGFFSGFSGFPPNISTFQFNKDKATCIYHPWLKLWKEIVVYKFLLQNKNTIGHVQGKVYWNIIWENANLLVPK